MSNYKTAALCTVIVMTSAWFLLAAGPAFCAVDASGSLTLGVIDDYGSCTIYADSAVDYLRSLDTELNMDSSSPLVEGLAGVGYSARVDNVVQAEKQYDVDIWFMNSDLALSSLSGEDKEILKSDLRQGAVIGHYGDGSQLRDQLDILHKNRFSTNQDQSQPPAVFYNGTWDEHREDYRFTLSSALSVGRAWSDIFSWSAKQLLPSYETLSDSQVDNTAWVKIFDEQYDEQQKRSYITTNVYAYKLENTTSSNDWYRIDLQINASQIAGYRYTWPTEVGWYTKNIRAMIGPYTQGNMLIVKHMPHTTLSNTSVQLSLGGSLEGTLKKSPKSGVKLTAKYSYTYDCPDMVMLDTTNIVMGEAKWEAIPRQPTFFADGLILHPPATVAHTNYTFTPSIIIQAPKGSNLSFTYNGSIDISYHGFFKDSYDYAEVSNWVSINE